MCSIDRMQRGIFAMSSIDVMPQPASFGRASSKIYIDLSDVVALALKDTFCPGVLRTQLKVAVTLARSSLDVVPFSLHGGAWRNLRPLIEATAGDCDLIFRRLRTEFRDLSVSPSWRKPLQTVRFGKTRLAALIKRLFSRAPRLTAQSTLFIGGAFWTSPQVMRLCRQAIDARANVIVFVQDLIPVLHPEFIGRDFSNAFRQILSLPAHYIVTTDHNAESLLQVREQLGADKTQVSVVPLAHEFSGAERNAAPGPLPTERIKPLQAVDFVLCVGTIEIRKNHMMLFSIWDELVAERGDNLPLLVVAGCRGWKAEAALSRLDEFFGSGRIVFVEAPSDAELHWLYAACSFTVFPSLVEGWALPVGESLWFGKPCAASDTSSIPHVGGDLCAYFSPYHAVAMKDAIRALLDTNIRNAYRQRIARARLRTWVDVTADIGSAIVQKTPPDQLAPHQEYLERPVPAINRGDGATFADAADAARFCAPATYIVE
jgi:glycosyltransferase involved in cell wall biosynthesis